PEERTGPIVIPVKASIQDEPEERTRPAAPQPIKVEIKDEPEEGQPQPGKGNGAAIDPQPRVVYQYGHNMRFGIMALQDQFGRPMKKRITFHTEGGTSNTRIKVNGIDDEYGEPSGEWLTRAQPLPDDPVRQSRNRTVSVLQVSNVRGKRTNIKISQTLEVVP